MEIPTKNKQKPTQIIIIAIIKTPKQAISNYTKALFFHKLSGINNRPSFDHGRKGGFSLKVHEHHPPFMPKHLICKRKSLGMYSKQADTHFHGCSPRHVPNCCTKLAEAQRAPITPLPISHLCPQVEMGRKKSSTLFPEDGFNLFPQVKKS